MSDLAATQRRFLDALFAPGEPPGRLAIYRRNVLATLGEALAAAYPAVRQLVGAAFFDEAARRYALAAPSRCGDLNAFGDGFGAFLGSYPFAAHLPWLGDVARLEWAVHACHHAPDATPLDAGRLSALAPGDPERLRLRLQASSCLLRSRYPVSAIREANVDGRDGTPRRLEGEDFLLVRREGVRVVVESLDASEWRFLERVSRGEPLGEACAAFADPARELGPCLARHARAGLFAGFEIAAGA